MREQGQKGLLVKSARCQGADTAIFNAQRLSNVRDKVFLTYRINPAHGRAKVERKVGAP